MSEQPTHLPDMADILAVRLSREGGLLFAPALARPRQFVLRDCSGALRDRVYRALLAAWPIAQAAPASTGDQRVYRLELDVATRDSAMLYCFEVPEAAAPHQLVQLWRAEGAEH